MRIYADKLADHLAKHLKQVYLIFGNEPLLIQESRQAIQKTALQHGFEERHRFAVDASLDWNQVYDCFQALSLFSSRQLIELEIPESGVNTAISKELQTLCDMLHDDIMLVIIGTKLTKAQENAKWFKALNAKGDWVSCLTPDLQRLPMFVQTRCRALGLKPDQQSLQMLAQWHEGNLFALSQSLEKLALLYPDGELTVVRLEEALSRHNHFTTFNWIGALLAGKANRAQRILRQLEAEGIETVILIRSVQKEFNQLLSMHQDLTQMSISQVFEKYRVWQNKRPLYNAALMRLSASRICALISLLAQAEIKAKTQYDESVWPTIHQLSLETCSPDIKLAI
ncbi:TPA: DNA polymerase III subunit delta [Vibrio parahaemolyticus]|uniref:DNA polymerase III subunit delta n=1 Tax=Vibrio parahaemolyticus TaxID=670 RepID=UPI00064AA91C|nr:DNA polymerase III subunit delta [Vibrio parahaemolyticus]EGR1981998.1 DNA polymerase III subunit delta [Vibrio parahaemolyticus]EII3439737.1 DNA polymerase III subunit delta [Vibrio parahaemolyticus]ELA7841954.1 DNA polymerase III subunit delta [Vibrio parahaemolyticus]ELA7843295.1 DNA polymerase III subunit delta [Vibrio parahaemolyticus]OXD32868.1 DNA polymerase III subunit delta [Vibrio parahaemolyticus]